MGTGGKNRADRHTFPAPALGSTVAHQIELPVPFPLKTVNAWLFPGDRPVLLDCGIGDQRSYEMLIDGIRDAGVDPSTLHLHISHGHVDHVGNAHRLQADFGIPLVCPSVEAPHVSTFRRDEGPRNDAYAAALRAHGMDPDRVEEIRAESDAIDAYTEDARIDHDVAHGETFLFGNDQVEAIRTPGHTPGSTCYVVGDHILTGDTLLERITSNAVELKDDDKGTFHQYVQTIDTLRAYVGLEALPGHRARFQLTDDILDYHLEFHEQRRQRILSLLDRPKSAWQLFPEVFPGLDNKAAHFMGMTEIVGHLHSLEIDGLVAVSNDGVRRFVRAH